MVDESPRDAPCKYPEKSLNQTSLFYADTPCAHVIKNENIIVSLNPKSYERIEIQHTSSIVFQKYIKHNIVACSLG
jgi:hypothetical protein